MDPFILMVIAILVALAFDVMNGFHDTANSVATVIYTKALPPQVAIGIASIMNIVGPFLLGTAVAKIIASSIIPTEFLSIEIIIGAAHGRHCLGSDYLVLRAPGKLVACINRRPGRQWPDRRRPGRHKVVRAENVFLALLISPIVGIILGMAVMFLVGRYVISRLGTARSNSIFKKIQIISSACVSLTHGSNDAQKTMGIVAMFVAVTYGYDKIVIEPWMVLACALSIGFGTALGGWRIIRTLGEKIGKEELSPSQGFAAETGTAITIAVGSHFGAPISTTHVLSSSVVGTVMIGGIGVLNKNVVVNILTAWGLTIPVAAIAAAISYFVLTLVGI